MKKLLLFSALALLTAPTFAEGEAEPVNETETLYFIKDSWSTGIVSAPGVTIKFDNGNGQFNIKTFDAISDVSAFKITLKDFSTAGAVRAVLSDGTWSNDAPFVDIDETGVATLTIPDDWKSKTNVTLQLKRNLDGDNTTTVSANIAKVEVVKADSSTEEITSFEGGSWGYQAIQSPAATFLMDGSNWGGFLVVDKDGNDISWDPETDADVTYTFTINFTTLEGEMLFQYDNKVDGATDYVNTENERIQPGQATATLVINKDSQTKGGTVGSALNRLYVKNWYGADTKSPSGNYTVVISGGTLTKTTYGVEPTPEPTPDPTALNPVQAPTVVSTLYQSLTGYVGTTPFRGINIVRQTLSDGSVHTFKAVMK